MVKNRNVCPKCKLFLTAGKCNRCTKKSVVAVIPSDVPSSSAVITGPPLSKRRKIIEDSSDAESITSSLSSSRVRRHPCKNCGAFGHIQKTCRNKKDGFRIRIEDPVVLSDTQNLAEPSSVKFCTKCRGRGHNASSCKNRKDQFRVSVVIEEEMEETSAVIENPVDVAPIDDPNDAVPNEAGNDGVVEAPGDIGYGEGCSCCHRISTDLCSVEYLSLEVEFSNRLYGDRVSEGDVVCKQCLAYLAKVNKKTNWCNAWPAFIYTLLTDRRYQDVSENLVSFLPDTVRSTYSQAVDQSGLRSVRDVWNTPSLFVDLTSKIKWFDQSIQSGILGNLTEAANSTAYPEVFCPMGCHAHVESLSDGFLDLLEAHHYLKTFANFNSFNANAKYCSGFKPTWPKQMLILEHFLVSPSLYIDNRKGLCIIMCSSSVHSDGRREYLHPPHNPVLGNDAPDFEEILAPVTVCPKIVRPGKSNSHNTSYSVCRLEGKQAGVSSFTLRTDRDVGVEPSELQSTNLGLTLKGRPDIYAAMVDQTFLPTNYIRDTYSYSDPSQNELLTPELLSSIESARTSGTHVSIHDALLLAKCTTTKHSAAGSVDDDNEGDCSKIVPMVLAHPTDGYGHKPLTVQQSSTHDDDAKFYLPMSATLSILSNCRPMYHLFLKCAAAQRNNKLFKDVHDIISKLSTLLNLSPYKRLLKIGQDLLESMSLTNFALESESRVVFKRILSRITDVSHVDVNEGDDISLLLNAVNDLLLVDCLCDVDVESIPLESSDNSSSLIFAICFNNNDTFSYCFRWKSENTWWFCAPGSSPKKFASFSLSGPSFLIYASKSCLRCLDESESLSLSGAETKLRCAEHQCCMVQDFRGGDSKCSLCSNKRAFKCTHSLFPGQTCTSGLCLKHAKSLRLEEHPQEVPQCPDNLNLGENAADEYVELVVPQDEPTDCEFSLDLNADLNVPQVLSSGSRPVHREDYGSATSGHFLLNNQLGCFARSYVSNKPPIKWQQQLAMIQSMCPEKTFPLIYPEGLLFPSIFPVSTPDGSVVGAIPSVFYGEHGKHKSIGAVASLMDHLRVRMRDGSSLTSTTEAYISFTFDVMLNHLLYHNTMSVAFDKGLEHLVKMNTSVDFRQRSLPFDEIESSIKACNLAAMQRDIPWTYFVTFTCNDLLTFGVAPIRQAIDALDLPHRDHQRVLQNYCMIMTRAWHRSCRLFFKVILKNSNIFGRVRRIYARNEFQSTGSPGNKPHIHCGISLEPGSSTEHESLERIAGRIGDAFGISSLTDEKSLKDQGLVSDYESFVEKFVNYKTLQTHSCYPRCKINLASGEVVCRNRVHPVSNTPTYLSCSKGYESSMPILKALGFTYINSANNEVVVERLCPGIYRPATEDDSSYVATIPLLQATFDSQTNVQMCDPRAACSYISKYIVKSEERRQVVVHWKDDKTITTEPRELVNDGINSARIAEANRLRKMKAPPPMMREISHSETCFFVSDLDYEFTNVVFVRIHTQELESRVAVVKFSTNSAKIVDLAGKLRPVVVRQLLPPCRQFTENQQILIRDFATSQYCVDITSRFGLRTPELRHVDSLDSYCKWFVWKPVPKFEASVVFSDCPWIDGNCSHVKIRKYYLTAVLEHYTKLISGGNSDEVVGEMSVLLSALQVEMNLGGEPSSKLLRFVDMDADKEVITVFSNVNPIHIHKFVYHLILLMGRFHTELDFLGLSLVQILEHVHLIPSAENVSLDDADNLCRKYIDAHLRFLGLTMKQINALLPVLYHGLRRFLTEPEDGIGHTPLLTYRSISESALEKLQQFESILLNQLVDALQHGDPQIAALREQLLLRQAVDCEVSIHPADLQSQESVEEQCCALAVTKSAIDSICNPQTRYHRSVILAGPPGAGKTHVMMRSVLYALSKSLRVALTSITSERSRALGGEHLHWLFCIPVSPTGSETSASLASKTISALSKNKVKAGFLKRLDVLFFEEIGLLSANLLATLDIVFRAVREVTQPFGGVLLIGTGDQEQLSPVDGLSIFRTQNLGTLFKIAVLKHLVRSRGDGDLRRLIVLLRQHPLSPVDKTEIIEIITRRCSRHFFAEWKDVPDGILRVVGKKSAEKLAISEYIKVKMADRNCRVHIEVAKDLVESSSGNWVDANGEVTSKLNYNGLELQKLHIFKGAVMKFTYNNSRATGGLPRFSQGQLCVVEGLPDGNDLNPVVVVRIVPPGERHVSGGDIPHSWLKAKLRKRSSIVSTVAVGMVKAKRIQYPLRYNVCCTVHKAIGCTSPALATQMSKRNSKYKLWDLHQFLVIVSRVPSLNTLYFVGSLSDTIEAVEELLNIDDPSTAVQAKIVESANCLRDGPAIVPADRPLSWSFIDCDVPSVAIGFIYFVASAKDLNVIKLGHCGNIRKELEKFNTPAVTDDHHYAPYVLIAFISGFFGEAGSPENLQNRERFLNLIKNDAHIDDQFVRFYRSFKLSFQYHSEASRDFQHLLLKECYNIPEL